MTKIRIIFVLFFSLTFLAIALQPAFSRQDNQYRSFDSYDTRAYDLDEFKHISGQPQPQLKPSFWQGFLSGMNNFLTNIK